MVRPDVKEKRKIMYERYGGMMTVTDVSKELGVSRQGAADWLEGRVKGCQVGKRIKFETDMVAKAICDIRGFC